jgi:hypothetical protein
MGKPKTTLVHFPLVEGQREDADPKMLPDGYLVRVKNMRLRAEARWGVRYDYDAIATTTQLASALRATDLVSFDDRLFALGDSNSVATTPSLDLYEHVDHSQFAWNGTDPNAFSVRLGLVTDLRDIGRPPSQTADVTILDCAAHDGLVCLVFETSSASIVHIFRADTDATLLFAEVAITKPRVVVIDGVFFIGGISGTTVALRSYDPSTDQALQTETDVFSAGAAITHWDFAATGAGDGAWAVVHRSTPTTSIRRLNSSGAVALTFAGPATSFTRVTITETSSFVALVVVETAGSTVDMYTYTHAGALNAGPTSLFGVSTTSVQPGVVDQSVSATDVIAVYAEVAATPGTDIRYESRRCSDHVLLTQETWPESSLTSMPAVCPGAEDFIHVFGGAQIEGDSPSGVTLLANYLGLMQQQIIGAFKERFTGSITALTQTPRIGRDSETGKFYWPNLAADGDERHVPLVTEFTLAGSGRRQTAQIGGLLYIAGGVPQIFDGRQLFEAGFQEMPIISTATPSNGGGSLPSSVSLLVAVTWEWRDSKGNFHTSRPSLVTTVTMGASDDTITVVASAPHSLRKNLTSDVMDGTVTVVCWRSVSGINQLRRADTELVTDFGESVTFVLVSADSIVRTGAVIYTQGGRGVLSAIEPHEAPLPAEYIWRFGDRLLTAGGPNRYQAQVSKRLFAGEPVQWSGASGFFIRGPETAINGVAAIGNRGILCTAEKLYHFAGDGPDDDGANGYRDAVEIDGSIGLMGWRSLVSTPIGLMFQGSDGQLWVLPVDGSPPSSFRQVQDTLEAFPTVVAAVLSTDEQLVSFFCSNAGGTDSRIVSFDLQAKTWIVDEFATATPITAATSYQGRIVYLSGGIAYQERSAHPPATFIEHGIITGDLKPFGGAGYGEFVSVPFLGEMRGDHDLRLRFSLDSGTTWATCKTFEHRTATDAVGKVLRRSWAPLTRKGDRCRLEILARTPGSATEGLVFNQFSLELIGASGAARRPSRERG